jgi:hypothetical protein
MKRSLIYLGIAAVIYVVAWQFCGCAQDPLAPTPVPPPEQWRLEHQPTFYADSLEASVPCPCPHGYCPPCWRCMAGLDSTGTQQSGGPKEQVQHVGFPWWYNWDSWRTVLDQF